MYYMHRFCTSHGLPYDFICYLISSTCTTIGNQLCIWNSFSVWYPSNTHNSSFFDHCILPTHTRRRSDRCPNSRGGEHENFLLKLLLSVPGSEHPPLSSLFVLLLCRLPLRGEEKPPLRFDVESAERANGEWDAFGGRKRKIKKDRRRGARGCGE
jgi:hypothetical protein